MRAGTGTEPVKLGRYGSSRPDGLHSLGGTGNGAGGKSQAQGSDVGTRRSDGGNDGGVSEAPWFAPVEDDELIRDCPGGVCPVPWATTPVFTIEEPPKIAEDTVNHPSHYTDGGIEAIEAIEAQLTAEEFRGYLKGNIAKYIWRERHKGGIESLKKARWYLDRLIDLDEVQNG